MIIADGMRGISELSTVDKAGFYHNSAGVPEPRISLMRTKVGGLISAGTSESVKNPCPAISLLGGGTLGWCQERTTNKAMWSPGKTP